MKKLKIEMLQHVQRMEEAEQHSINLLTNIATASNITYDVLHEDVLNVLTNLTANIEAGKGLLAMGGNVNNYSYFLAGLAAIVRKLMDPQNPPPQATVDNVLKILSGLNIVGGLVNANCQKIVDFGARPENQGLASQYEKLVKGMAADPAALVNAIGKLKIAMNKIKVATPAANTPQAMKTKPVTATPNTLPPSGPSKAGNSPSGGGAGV